MLLCESYCRKIHENADFSRGVENRVRPRLTLGPWHSQRSSTWHVEHTYAYFVTSEWDMASLGALHGSFPKLSVLALLNCAFCYSNLFAGRLPTRPDCQTEARVKRRYRPP